MKWLIRLMLVFLYFGLYACENNDVEIIDEDENENVEILVNIQGKVKFPGIYRINQEKYLYEIIEMAGGLLNTADTKNINLVQLIDKSCTINILGMETSEENSLININYASFEQLLLLPGIGNSFANKIIEYRQTVGFFKTIEDIKLIPGIKDNVFNQIKDKITV